MANLRNASYTYQIQHNDLSDISFEGSGNTLNFAPVQNTVVETQVIQISAQRITQQKLIKASPYKGLNRFNASDRDRFHGRDRLIQKLLRAVNRNELTLITGASGSGKSSLMRAGVIPELKQSLAEQTFYDFIFTPGQDPFESLYRCLLSEEKDYHFEEIDASIALRRSVNTLPEIVSHLKGRNTRWLWLIDQFEELFTNCADEVIRQNFIESLVKVVQSDNKSVRIVLVMRADFLEQFSFYRNLGALLDHSNIHLVTEMHPDELRQAIEQPAAQHGVVFEAGLVERIIHDVQGQRGYLPLLQYTLNLLWDTECKTRGTDNKVNIEDRTLNISTYTSIEGVRGALQRRVDELYRTFSLEKQVVTKQIFLKLVNIVDTEGGSRPVSRRANRCEFQGDDTTEKVLDKFIQEKLLVSSTEYESQQVLLIGSTATRKQLATIEIAHEILLSSWSDLKRWIEEERENIILKNYLADETRRWRKIRDSQGESKAHNELLKGSRLEQISVLRDTKRFEKIGGISPSENEFIDASILWQDEQNKQQQKRRRNTVISLSSFSLIALVLGIWGLTSSYDARRNLELAEENAAEAEERALIAELQTREAVDWIKNTDYLIQRYNLPQEGYTIGEALSEKVYSWILSHSYEDDSLLSELTHRIKNDCPDAITLGDCDVWFEKLYGSILDDVEDVKSW